MIEHELLFLGLLMERPKHGYDIKCQIHNELSPCIGLDINSIYYPLRKLEGSGLIQKHIDRAGNRPEKRVYSITRKGRIRFRQLISRSLVSVERPYFHIHLSFYFINYININQAKRRLRARVSLLKKVRDQLKLSVLSDKTHNGPAFRIVRHDLDLCEAEIQSVSRLADTL